MRWFLLLALVMLTSCRTTREASTVERVVRDTVRVVRVARDTVAVRDTVRERYWTSADTVWAVREVTRWRERVSRERDTLWRARTDTVRVMERVEVERAAPAGRWVLLFIGGMVCVGVCIFAFKTLRR